MIPPKRHGIAGLAARFGYALRGLGTLFASQANARIQTSMAVVVVAAGFWFRVTRLEWCALVVAIGLVLTAEGLNTALEFLTDLVSPEYHPLAGKAKDVAAGAVLIASITAAVIGLIIFLPRLAALAGW